LSFFPTLLLGSLIHHAFHLQRLCSKVP